MGDDTGRATGDDRPPSGDDRPASGGRCRPRDDCRADGGLEDGSLADRVGAPPTILVVDNYDSFAYNLVQYVGDVVTRMGGGPDDLVVRRNDDIDLADVESLDPDGIVVSPGPGTPADAGVSMPIFAELRYPTLGVCLGHQALCAANGATVGQATDVVHGKPSTITHDGEGVFDGLPNPIEAGRYHSLGVAREDVPDGLVVTAHARGAAADGGSSATDTDSDRDRTRADGAATIPERRLAMAVRHRERPHVGLQFHPESILTDGGERLVETFCLQCSTT